jgi:hypothetical protein
MPNVKKLAVSAQKKNRPPMPLIRLSDRLCQELRKPGNRSSWGRIKMGRKSGLSHLTMEVMEVMEAGIPVELDTGIIRTRKGRTQILILGSSGQIIHIRDLPDMGMVGGWERRW